MLRTTLSKIKKAWALALASRGRGDVRAYPSKFHKLSIAVLKTDKYPDTEKEQCEKCKQLLEYIFGPAKPIDDVPKAIKTKSDVAIPTYAYTQWKNDKDEALIKAITLEQQEQLTQKVEDINEPSVVEAERKKIDDHNAPPKVLGHMAEIAIIDENNRLIYGSANGTVKQEEKDGREVNIDMRDKIDELVRKIEAANSKPDTGVNTREGDLKTPVLGFATDNSAQNSNQGSTTDANEQNSFDAIAKRCLESPSGRIDEHLLKEMKKYGVPQGSPDSSMIQIGVIKKRKPVDKTEYEFESRTLETADPNLQYRKTDALTPERTKILRQDKNVRLEGANNQQAQTQYIDNEPRPQFNPLVPIIDPYDKKSLTFEKDDFECPRLTYFESNDERAAREHAEKTGLRYEQPFQIPGPMDYPGYGMSGQESSQNTLYQNFVQPQYKDESNQDSSDKTNAGLYDQNTIIPEGSETNEATNLDAVSPQNQQQDITGQPENLFDQGSDQSTFSHTREEQKFHWFGETGHIDYELKDVQPDQVPSRFRFTRAEEQETAPEEKQQEVISMATLNMTPISPTEPPKDETNNTQAKFEGTDTITENPAILNAKSTREPVKPKDPAKGNHTTIKQAAAAASICSLPKLKEIPVRETVVPREISRDFVEPKPIGNPVNEPDSKDFEELPKLCPKDEDVSLSELLRRVRLRNRIEYCRTKQALDTVEGKCGTKKPPCPPPAPKCTPCPPPCSPPQPPPCPRPCKQACPNPCPPTSPTCPPSPPTCPSPCQKFSLVYLGIAFRQINIITLLLNANTKPSRTFISDMNSNHYFVKAQESVETKVDVIGKLQNLRSILTRYCILFGALTTSKNLDSFARDFEPWVPIPCWPVPKKEEKRPFVCPKEGCKVTPPKLGPPCQDKLNPCLNFPKRARFSLIDLLNTARFT